MAPWSPAATWASAARPAGSCRRAFSRVPGSVTGSAAATTTGIMFVASSWAHRLSSTAATGAASPAMMLRTTSESTVTLPPRSTPMPPGRSRTGPPGSNTMPPIPPAVRVGMLTATSTFLTVVASGVVTSGVTAAPARPCGRCTGTFTGAWSTGPTGAWRIGPTTTGGTTTWGGTTGAGVTATSSTASIAAAGTAPRLMMAATAPVSLRRASLRTASPLGRSMADWLRAVVMESARSAEPAVSPRSAMSTCARAAPSTSEGGRIVVVPSGPPTGATNASPAKRCSTVGANAVVAAARPVDVPARAMRLKVGSTVASGRRLRVMAWVTVMPGVAAPRMRACAGEATASSAAGSSTLSRSWTRTAPVRAS